MGALYLEELAVASAAAKGELDYVQGAGDHTAPVKEKVMA